MNLRQLARTLTNSRLFQRGRVLWEANQRNWNLPLSKSDKLLTGMYAILGDYAEGRFPPVFEDQQKAYDAEIAYRHSLPGKNVVEISTSDLCKPFWFGKSLQNYLKGLVDLVEVFESLGIMPGQSLLELGCGSGWMGEALAQMEYDVVGTTIAPDEVEDARKRIAALKVKGIQAKLDYRVAPMESVHEVVHDRDPFDAVFVYEALHHAYSWQKAIESSYACLKRGGWLVIANEPNRVHTYSSYRVAKLANTHEIGMDRGQMCAHLREVGFSEVRILKNKLHYYVRPHWIAARK
ncbi:class I SAM-dependent methyltransferase [Verrucomicrobiota bacterium sgz303538]